MYTGNVSETSIPGAFSAPRPTAKGFPAAATQRKECVYLMRITVCIGSSCHVKGSRQVVKSLQQLIADHNLGDKVELAGTFCMSNCQQGVCVTVDDVIHSVSPESTEAFFNDHILAKV